MLKKVFFALMLLPVLSFAGAPRGEKLEKWLWKQVSQGYLQKVEKHTSREFQGFYPLAVFNRAKEMKVLKHHKLVPCSFHNMRVTEGENSIVVTYEALSVSTDTNNTKGFGSDLQKQSVQCMSTWKKIEHTWKWVAHAEVPFNVKNEFSTNDTNS